MNTLSEAQRQAVEYIDGPSLVIAGAGSGKTRVLTYKIAYLLQNGYKPWNILALTFTNKAAKEMRERIGKLLDSPNTTYHNYAQNLSQYLAMGTFHSIFARILRYEAEAIGFSHSYTIYDDADSKALIKEVTKSVLTPTCQSKAQLDTLLKSYKLQNIASTISMAKNHLLTAQMYSANNTLVERDKFRKMPLVYKIYEAYEARLKECNAMDFDDLLLKTYQLFCDHEDVRQKYAQQYQFVLVDEYQDTNTVQQKIIELIVRDHHRVCVVGDDAQSIYAFRGANINNILNFQQLIPDTKLFKLEENYRSTKSIVALANDLIAHNERQIQKSVFSNQATGEKPQLIKTVSDKEEAAVICKKIIRIHSVEHIPYDDFAILYRTNAQSRQFEEAFRKEQLPYRIYSGMSFYQRAEIKNIIAYFRLVVNPNDNEALRRIINYPKRGIGQTTLDKLQQEANDKQKSLWGILQDNPNVSTATLKKIKDFRDMIADFITKLTEMDAATLGRHIIKTAGISEDLYSDMTPEGVARQENLQELANSLNEFVQIQREEGNVDDITLTHFLQQAALQTDQEAVDARDDDSPKITMMTMHAAKGLEFDTVFIVGLEEEIFPSPRCTGSQRALEEERRLLYVAITRAKRLCHLSYAENRFTYGIQQSNPPCRFIKEINPELLGSTSGMKQFSMKNAAYGGKQAYYGKSEYTRDSSFPGSSYSRRPTNPVQKSPQIAVPENFHRIQTVGTNIPPSYSSISQRKETLASIPASTPIVTTGSLSVGNIIEHSRFGRGRVLRIEGSGENAKATVEFENTGMKQLLLKFARFSIIK